MKTLISLPVHECRRTIEDQLRNLTYHFEDATIVLHLSQSYKESSDFDAFPNVIVNPVRLPTKWGNIGYLHIANVRYARERGTAFDYVVFCSSNELYFRKGVEAYLATADALVDARGMIIDGKFQYEPPRSAFYATTSVISRAFADERWLAFLKKHKLPGMCKSQIEGSAYRKEVILRMLACIDEEFDMQYLQDLGWCGEEILIPTVFLAIDPQRKLKIARHCSFVDWTHDFTPRLWIRAIRHWRGERRDERVAKLLAMVDAVPRPFAVKGVPRTYYNAVRDFIRSGVPQPTLSKKQQGDYRHLDKLYRRAALRKKLTRTELVVAGAQLAMRAASRVIGKPRGYVAGTLRDRRMGRGKRG